MTGPIAQAREGKALEEWLWHDGTHRGQRLVRFLESAVGDLRDNSVLDLGCAAGGITRVIAGRAQRAFGVDHRWENVRAARRAPGRPERRHPWFLQGDALRLPFRDHAFDVVLLSGLLEWMGFAQPRRPPCAAQLETLREVHRVLAPGGRVIIGIENRWFPKFLWRSPHQHLLLALLLPARLSWALPAWVYGGKVHERLYGPPGLARLLRRAGFGQVEPYIPLFGYQFPREVVRSDDGRGLLAALRRTRAAPQDEFESVSTGGVWGRRWFFLIATLRLQRWLAPALLMVGRKVT